MIAKRKYGSGGSGTYLLVLKSGGNGSDSDSDFVEYSDNDSEVNQARTWRHVDGHDLPRTGTLLTVERYEAAFHDREYRQWFTFIDQERTSTMFTMVSNCSIQGDTRGQYDTFVGHNVDANVPFAQREGMKRSVSTLMKTSEYPDIPHFKNLNTMDLRFLMFRADYVVAVPSLAAPENRIMPVDAVGGSLILNELDMWPIGYTFIDTYEAFPGEIKQIAESMDQYIMSHWSNGWQY